MPAKGAKVVKGVWETGLGRYGQVETAERVEASVVALEASERQRFYQTRITLQMAVQGLSVPVVEEAGLGPNTIQAELRVQPIGPMQSLEGLEVLGAARVDTEGTELTKFAIQRHLVMAATVEAVLVEGLFAWVVPSSSSTQPCPRITPWAATVLPSRVGEAEFSKG